VEVSNCCHAPATSLLNTQYLMLMYPEAHGFHSWSGHWWKWEKAPVSGGNQTPVAYSTLHWLTCLDSRKDMELKWKLLKNLATIKFWPLWLLHR